MEYLTEKALWAECRVDRREINLLSSSFEGHAIFKKLEVLYYSEMFY
jgi:hypothetical protein